MESLKMRSSAIFLLGLAWLVAANKQEDGVNSLRGAAAPLLRQMMTGPAKVFDDSRRLYRRGRRRDDDDEDGTEESWRRGNEDDDPNTGSLTSREYMGCYSDDKEDRIMGYRKTRRDMTTEICRAYCKEMNKGHLYYATQFGSECWCGKSDMFMDYDRHGTGICDYVCAGNEAELCGGHNAFDLYRFIGDDDGPSPSPSPRPQPAPVEPNPEPVVPAPQPVEPTNSENYGEMAYLLELHNDVRCMHNAKSLSYSDEIASTAESYARFLTDTDNCGKLFHSTGNGYGENLFLCGTSDTSYDCYEPELAMYGFYDNETRTDSVERFGGHATQILWKDTTDVGCATHACLKGGWRYNVLVCNYDPPGNVRGQYTAKVEKKSKSDAQCGYSNRYK